MDLNSKYKPLFNSKANYFIVTGGRGSGKSFGVNVFTELLTFERGHTILFTRYTMASAGISVIPEFSEKIELLGHTNLFKVNKTDIENKTTGSNILFRGIKTSSGNQTASLKSIQNVSTWVLDEAEELHCEETFDKIDNSIRNKSVHNRVILILNPATKEHWIYKRFFEAMGVEPGFNGIVDNVAYIHTTFQDNKANLSEKFIHSAEKLKSTNPLKYNHIMLGGWLDKADGVIFDNWSYGDFDESLPFGYGMDFGFFPDPDVLVKVAIDTKRKKIYCKEELKLNNAGVDQLADNMKRVLSLDKTINADCAEPRLISDIKKRGIKNIKAVQKGAGSVLAGIKIMQDYEIIVHPESTGIGAEFNNYVWSDKKSGVPIDAYNHFIDAIRYRVQSIIKPNAARGQRIA